MSDASLGTEEQVWTDGQGVATRNTETSEH